MYLITWITTIVCLFDRNASLNWALLFETALAIFFLYCPGMDKGLRMYPLRFVSVSSTASLCV